jgi:hypothetical protein
MPPMHWLCAVLGELVGLLAGARLAQRLDAVGAVALERRRNLAIYRGDSGSVSLVPVWRLAS